MVQACADNVRPAIRPTIVYFSIFTYYSWKEILAYQKGKEVGNTLFDWRTVLKIKCRSLQGERVLEFSLSSSLSALIEIRCHIRSAHFMIEPV